MQCKTCYKIGYTKNQCLNTETCPTCSLAIHPQDQLCSQLNCVNCNLQHQSTNPQYPKLAKPQEIIKHSTINKTSMAEATRHINTNYPADQMYQ